MEKSLSTIAKAYFIRPLFTAILAVAMVFTFGCSGDDDGSGGGNDCSQAGGSVVDFCPESSSSRQVSSSSSISGGSGISSSGTSSCVGGGSGPSSCVGGTVKIGTQVWQKCNSDAVPSKGVYKCYDNLESNCQKYGKLYDWEAANFVCPSGFHLPSREDWDALASYIEGDKGCTGCYAKHLKISEWCGLDSYGFSALPGGSNPRTSNVSSDYDIGTRGSWWSSSESNSSFAPYLSISYNSENGLWVGDVKRALHSVRCLKDD